MKTQILIYKNYGAFQLNKEMTDYLVNNKNWKIIKSKDINYSNNKYKTELENNTLIEFFDTYTHLNNDSIEFRTNPDLIECYKTIKKLNKNNPKNMIHNFKLIEVEVSLEIHDEYDGIENVVVNYSKNELD